MTVTKVTHYMIALVTYFSRMIALYKLYDDRESDSLFIFDGADTHVTILKKINGNYIPLGSSRVPFNFIKDPQGRF